MGSEMWFCPSAEELMPFGGLDYPALADKAEIEAGRAPTPVIAAHWKLLAKEYRKLAELIGQQKAKAAS